MDRKAASALGIVTIPATLLVPGTAQAAIPMSERDALIALYNSTDGDNWHTNRNWRKAPGVFNDAGTECTWSKVVCDAAGTTVRRLLLDSNQLTGAIPPELGNLLNPVTSTNFPPGLRALDLRWNALFIDDDTLRKFLNSKQRGGNWESTQTVAPENLAATPFPLSPLLSRHPIAFTQQSGRYRVFSSTSSGGPHQLFGTTMDKTTSSLEVTGLMPATDYFFVVQSETDPHPNNQNTVTSGNSMELMATTTTTTDITATKEGVRSTDQIRVKIYSKRLRGSQ